MEGSKNVLINVTVFFLIYFLNCTSATLIVNVKNKGGTVKEKIVANIDDDTITLDFIKSDGTLITQFIDFKSEIQIFKALVLGEEERGQSQYQTMCYVVRFIQNEFMSSDAMSKLRQKNPGAVRKPEEDRGQEKFDLDLAIDLDQSQAISPHLFNICQEAKDATYTSDKDLKLISQSLTHGARDFNKMMYATRRVSSESLASCRVLHSSSKPCSCQYEVCIGWYPCGLKFCKGKDSVGKTVSYRCGIKTCRKCRLFEYQVLTKKQCLWDEV